MRETPGHSCLASGGAHHFVPDEAGVPICACGEIEVSPEEQLLEAELLGGPFPGDVLAPRARRRRVLMRVDAVMRSRGLRGVAIDEVLAEQERAWVDGGGALDPQDI